LRCLRVFPSSLNYPALSGPWLWHSYRLYFWQRMVICNISNKVNAKGD
jgi:hypothetical protein